MISLYKKQEMIDYLSRFGWTESRCIKNLDIPKLYSRFFDYLEHDEELNLYDFPSYKPFPKLFDFWELFGNMDIKFKTPEGRSGVITINEISIHCCTDFSVIQTSIHYHTALFPVAMIEIYRLFLAIDSSGFFHGIYFDGAVSHFSDDFFEVLDIFINGRPLPEKEYFTKYE